jgi:uncharacterized membrane protein
VQKHESFVHEIWTLVVGFRVLGVVKRKTHLIRESFEIATQTLFKFLFKKKLILMLVLFLVRIHN